MSRIKQRRLQEITLSMYPDLFVGHCVPFYFCPRSIMLYIIYQANHPDLAYTGGQGHIVHLQADLHAVVTWANKQDRRWAFTLSNASSSYFEDRNNLADLDHLDWKAIQATEWKNDKNNKQAEFLLEQDFPWHLIEAIAVYSDTIHQQVIKILKATPQPHPIVKIESNWYY